MSKNKKLILKVTALLMVYALIVPNHGSSWLIGEPKLPRKLRKDDTVMN